MLTNDLSTNQAAGLMLTNDLLTYQAAGLMFIIMFVISVFWDVLIGFDLATLSNDQMFCARTKITELSCWV